MFKVCANTRTYTHTNTYIHPSIHPSIHTYTHISIYIIVCGYMYICIYIYIYIYIYDAGLQHPPAPPSPHPMVSFPRCPPPSPGLSAPPCLARSFIIHFLASVMLYFVVSIFFIVFKPIFEHILQKLPYSFPHYRISTIFTQISTFFMISQTQSLFTLSSFSCFSCLGSPHPIRWLPFK